MAPALSSELTILPTHPLVSALDTRTIAGLTFPVRYMHGSYLATSQAVLATSTTCTGVFALVAAQAAAGEYAYSVELDVRVDGRLDSSCDCPAGDNHRVAWCAHQVAVALLVLDTAAGRTPVTGDDGLAQAHAVTDEGAFEQFNRAEDLPESASWITADGGERHIAVREATTRKMSRCGLPLGTDLGCHRGTPGTPLCARCRASFHDEVAARRRPQSMPNVRESTDVPF